MNMKIEIELNVLQQILDALCYAHATNRYESERQDKAIKALRKALTEPGAFIQKGYKIVPIKPPEDALEVARRAYRNASVYDVAHVWHAIITALPNSPLPPLVPLLTDNEINVALHVALPSLSYASEAAFVQGVRFGEQAVRQKAGIK